MIEFYPQIKWVHVAAALASGSLFFIRGLLSHLGATWTMAAPLRYLSYSIDTVLLTAAFMLATILQQFPFAHSWLTAKVLLLVAYVVLGSYALKRGQSRRVRSACWLAAIVVYLAIVSVARAHHPLGALVALAVTAGTECPDLPAPQHQSPTDPPWASAGFESLSRGAGTGRVRLLVHAAMACLIASRSRSPAPSVQAGADAYCRSDAVSVLPGDPECAAADHRFPLTEE